MGHVPAGACGRLSRPYSQLRTHSPPLISPHQAHAGIYTPPRGPPYSTSTQHINAGFGNEQVLAVHLQHHKPILVQSHQLPALRLRLPPSVGVYD